MGSALKYIEKALGNVLNRSPWIIQRCIDNAGIRVENLKDSFFLQIKLLFSDILGFIDEIMNASISVINYISEDNTCIE